MAKNFKYQFTKFSVEKTAGDAILEIESYLSDDNETPFLNSDNQLDLFTVETRKSSLPATDFTGVKNHLSEQIESFVAEKYTTTLNASITNATALVTGLSSTEGLIPGMSVLSQPLLETGIPGIPLGTEISTIKNSTQVVLSQNATQTQEETITFGTLTWTIDFDKLDNLVNIINFDEL